MLRVHVQNSLQLQNCKQTSTSISFFFSKIRAFKTFLILHHLLVGFASTESQTAANFPCSIGALEFGPSWKVWLVHFQSFVLVFYVHYHLKELFKNVKLKWKDVFLALGYTKKFTRTRFLLEGGKFFDWRLEWEEWGVMQGWVSPSIQLWDAGLKPETKSTGDCVV